MSGVPCLFCTAFNAFLRRAITLNDNFTALAKKFTYLLIFLTLVCTLDAFSQRNLIRESSGRLKQMGGAMRGGASTDSLKRRDKNEDSITIRFRYIDSTRQYMLDSSIADFTRRFHIPATHVYLGNNGTAARSILFSPGLQPGWDAGFHAFDIYKWTLEKARFFQTTRPYSELNYMLASRAEQVIELLHTQNIKPNFNFSFQYRLINAPGYFKNQKTNHNNYLFTTRYETVNKRYNVSAAIVGNKLQAGENGGILYDSMMDNPIFKDRFNISTKLGGDDTYQTNFFSTDVGTGNVYRDFTVYIRQQYDFGQKDSLVTDSTVIPLFYPRLRLEHGFRLSQEKYEFKDPEADSIYYHDNYGLVLHGPLDTVRIWENWKNMVNDFSIYQYPDAKNLHQFFKVGAALQNLTLDNAKGSHRYHNTYGHAEYRNRTRNQKWDLQASGKLYFTGLNSGDYRAYASLQRFIGKRLGSILLAFENVNRTPSFVTDPRSAFYIDQPKDLKKENTTHLFASISNPALRLKLSGHYYLLTNYSYFTNFYEVNQESTLFNMLRIDLQKTFKIGRRWFWHADIYLQKRIGNADVNAPVIFTRNRFGYEGNLGFRNLDIAFGTEIKYHTPYKADAWSPLLGQFYYQDSVRIENPLPDIAGYVHFRIKSFKFYFRAENLNTAEIVNREFGFTNNKLAAPGYYYPGLQIRVGVYWSFVN